jgi:hypothetical protein
MFSRKWTREDDLKLLDLKAELKPISFIAKALDRPVNGCSRRLHVLFTEGLRDVPQPPHRRPCLDCGREFDSEGIGNRICDLCKAVHRRNGFFTGEISFPKRK